MCWWILLLVLCNRYCQSAASSCDGSQYEKDGRCCSLCSPGQRLDKECTESSETLCVACKAGEYQDKLNREKDCLIHQECDENLGFKKISEGTAKKNVDCVCQDGKHCSSPACETCVFNIFCGPGKGVTRKADRYSDTECAPCPEGTFSNVTSDTESCKAWQSCTGSQAQIHPGTANVDVVCGPKNNAWIYIVAILIVLIIALVVSFFILKRQKDKKAKEKQQIQGPLVKGNEHQLFFELNIPEEDQDDQDITMQGLPVAQEEGKDCHMSQEEV